MVKTKQTGSIVRDVSSYPLTTDFNTMGLFFRPKTKEEATPYLLRKGFTRSWIKSRSKTWIIGLYHKLQYEDRRKV